MTNQPVLRARTQPATAPVPASEADAQLSVALREAQAVAKAGDAIPKGYRGNPGAVLLAKAWADKRGLDILTALQTVAFVQGRPVIDATMQRALAKQAGYRVTVTDASSTAATVKVVELASGEVIGEASYTVDDAKAAGLLGKDNWKRTPEDMLVARATTRAVRRYAPEVMVGLVAGTDELDEIRDREDPIAVLQDAGEDQDPQTVDVAHNPVGESEEPSGTPTEAPPESSPVTDADVEDAELVEVLRAEEPEPVSPQTRGKLLEARTRAKQRDDWPELEELLTGAGLKGLAPSKMTEEQAQVALEILS